MISYQPVLDDRKTVELAITSSPFRAACKTAIESLDPVTDEKLSLREQFSIANFETEPEEDWHKAAYAWTKLDTAIRQLESVKPLRENEPSKRWQANYDLLHAQCLVFRVRIVQYLIALDSCSEKEPNVAKHNRCLVGASGNPLIEPSAKQFARLKDLLQLSQTKGEFISRMKKHHAAAQQAFDEVISAHPQTPWAAIAEIEKRNDFGVTLNSFFFDPRFGEVGKRIKIPSFQASSRFEPPIEFRRSPKFDVKSTTV